MLKTSLAIALVAVSGVPAAAMGPRHFEIEARFERAPEPETGSVVAVRFVALDPDVNVNEIPAPRLELDGSQKLLRQKPQKRAVRPIPAAAGVDAPRYLDLAEPVRFPAELAPDAPEGFHGIAAEVIYFYCSKSQGWCRRGSEPVTIPIIVSH